MENLQGANIGRLGFLKKVVGKIGMFLVEENSFSSVDGPIGPATIAIRMADGTKVLDSSVLNVCITITTYASQFGGSPVLIDKSRKLIERVWPKSRDENEAEVCMRTFMFI